MYISDSTIAWLRLGAIPELAAAQLRKLLVLFGPPESILRATGSDLRRVLPDPLATAILRQANTTTAFIDAALSWLAAKNHALLTLADENYPRALLSIADPPPMLYAAGNTTLLGKPALAIVGSRNATPQGSANAQAFAKAISQAGIAVVSGLALGIDAAAHQGALEGPGSTIAILGCGLDQRYPKGNSALHAAIEARGLVISEFALGTAPTRFNFPRRNRIISGISLGCLVVEAAQASGSLITARLAAEQGRDVFAIPGSIHSPVTRGCHALIKQGAKLVETAADILEELRIETAIDTNHHPSGDDAPLLQYIGYDPCDLDTLSTRSGLTPAALSAILLQLELDGLVGSLPGGLYQRTK